MKIAFVVALLLLAGCPSEGGVAFSYVLYKQGNPPTAEMGCGDANVSRIRFLVGNDPNKNGLLETDELEGRAIADCNQVDRNSDGMLTDAEKGHFETPDDRLPTGEYDLFEVELAFEINGVVNTVQSRYFTDTSGNYYDGQVFGHTDLSPAVVISEGAVTQIPFTGYDGGTVELRLIVR